MRNPSGTNKVVVIGAGFAGLSAAAYLAKAGFEVTVIEKNEVPGGRARLFKYDSFVFDMGPSWYWMPDVFEKFFNDFGKSTADYYELMRLDPSYQVIFEGNEVMTVPAGEEALYDMFEKYEPGSSRHLKKFLKEAKYKYDVGMRDFVERPGHSIMEFADVRVLTALFRLEMFKSVSKSINKLFKNPKLIQLLDFPVLFLGATPQKTPALYSLMNYADMSLGTWYPRGGMHEIVKAMVSLCEELGVVFQLGEEVSGIDVDNGKVKGVHTATGNYEADFVVGGADYHHIEQQLLDKKWRNYTPEYWEKRTMAPSSLLFYVGVDEKVAGLLHHNLFFDADFEKHADEIYENPAWPKNPLFYVSCPSKTDATVAPPGKENLFILIPLAPGLSGDEEEKRDYYYNMVMERVEKLTGQKIRGKVIYKRSYAMKEFISDYHAFKGNAYGLANTLLQTAFLKPALRSKKVENLYFTGQLTTPGPGVPPSLISGRVVAKEIQKKNNKYYG